MIIICNEMQFKFRGFNVDLFNFYTGGISNYHGLLKYIALWTSYTVDLQISLWETE
jgi:prolipoprotein diacylglyceryltransferase